jgi:hypothetical protein
MDTLHKGDNDDDDDDDNDKCRTAILKKEHRFFGRIRPLALTVNTT